MILVAGATGRLGFEVCRQLREKGEAVAGLVRPGSQLASKLDAIGVQLKVGDLKDHGSLEAACMGATTIVSTVTATMRRRKGDTLKTVDHEGQLRLVACAASGGVRRFVYVSLGPNVADCPFVRYKRDVERAVQASGMEWSILQPGPFLDMWASKQFGWDLPRGRATILGRGDKPVSFVCVADVARFAVAAASGNSLQGRLVPVGGPDTLTPQELVGVCQSVSGKRFRCRRVPIGVLRVARAILRPFELPASLTTLALDMAERGDAIDMKETLGLISFPMTTVRQYVAAAIGALASP